MILVIFYILVTLLVIEYLTGNKIRTYMINEVRIHQAKFWKWYGSLERNKRKYHFEKWKKLRCMRLGCTNIDDYGGKYYDGFVWCELHCPCKKPFTSSDPSENYRPDLRKPLISEMSKMQIEKEYTEYLGDYKF